MSESCPSPQTARKLDPREVLDGIKRAKILALLAMGCSRRMAARQVGCARSTITRTADRELEFHTQLADAEAQADVRALRLISHAAQQEKYWRVAAWLLERRNPDEYGRRSPFTFTGQQVMALLLRGLKDIVPAVAKEKLPEVMMNFHDLISDVAESANLPPMEPEELLAATLTLPGDCPNFRASPAQRTCKVGGRENGTVPLIATAAVQSPAPPVPTEQNGSSAAPCSNLPPPRPATVASGRDAPVADRPIHGPRRNSCLEQYVQRSPKPELQAAGT